MRSFIPFCLLLVPALASGAPMLRLTQTVVGPVSIAAGAAGPTQEVQAFNAGDGSLNLTFTSSASWAVASAGPIRNCTGREGSCIPVRIAFPTQSLPVGEASATIIVRDPNALDAPQSIIVTVQIGGGVPSRLDFFVAPNRSNDEAIFNTNSLIGSTITTQSGGQWLSLALDGLGSLRFVLPYKVTAQHLPGLAEGVYNGAITVKDSGFALDNKTIQVTMRVTGLPIAAASQPSLGFSIAQNTRAQTKSLTITNRGQGSLNVTGASASTTSGGSWLSVQTGTDTLTVQADVAGLSPGHYKGSVSVSSNGANNPLRIPVDLELVIPSPPVISYPGVVNSVDYEVDDPIARGGIASIFGQQLSYAATQSSSSAPLGTELGGVRVMVNDRPAPILFASYGQVNFQVPFDAQTGPAVVRVDRDGQRGNTASTTILNSLPRILYLQGLYGIAVNSDGTFALPKSLGFPNSRPAHVGEAIVLYALGLGPTVPPVASGAAAPSQPPARVPSPITDVLFGALALPSGVRTPALYVGLTPGYVGLYQINVVVPEGVVTGDVPVRLQLETVASNYVLVAIE